MSTSPNLSTLQQQLTDHLRSTLVPEGPCDLQILAHGEANIIFRFNEGSLIRMTVNTPNQRYQGNIAQVTQFEHAILTYLQGSGIGHELYQAKLEPTPDLSYTYLITNYLEGIALDYSWDHLKQCGQTLARLHRLPEQTGYGIEDLAKTLPLVKTPLSLFYQEAKDYAQTYIESSDPDPEIMDMLRQVLDRAHQHLQKEHLLQDHPHLCLVHGDHTYGNWVINLQQAYLIDWEWAEVGTPAGDLGHFLSPVTVQRLQGYQLSTADRTFFLESYFEALEDPKVIETVKHHFAAFGPFPALRSLCWQAGYWVTASRWYADLEDSPSARERMDRFRRSQEQFPQQWQELMAWFEDPI